MRLKFLRTHHCDEEIGEQQQGNQAENEVFHNYPSEFFTPVGVEFTRHKEERDDGNEDEVGHGFCLSTWQRVWPCAEDFSPSSQLVPVHVGTLTQLPWRG